MAKPREKHIADRDRQIVAEMYLKGYTTRQIASYIGEKFHPYTVNYSTIANDIKWLLKQWLKETVQDIDQLKARELEKINKLENTYWEAWEKSITDYSKTSKKLKGESKQNKPTSQEVSTTEMMNMGNPSYLAGIQKCIELRCKILGIEAPQKIDHTTKGESINKPDLTKLSDDELRKLAELQSKSGISQT